MPNVKGIKGMEGAVYSQAFVREITAKVKTRNGRYRTEHRAWKGVLKYKAENPDYREPPEGGNDDRTPTQKRRQVWRQIAKTFDANEVKTKADALAALDDWRESMERKAAQTSEPTRNRTVGEYVAAYVDALESSQSVSMRTVHGYRTIAKRIDQGFQGMRMRELTSDSIQSWEGSLIGGGLSSSTVVKYHRLLSEVCKHAVNVDVLTKNPCAAVRTPKAAPPSPNSLTANDYARLAATFDAMEPTPIITAAAIALHTGLRQGEVCGLRWRCYDPEAKTLRVVESIGRAGGKTFSNAPKTMSSIRTVPVSPQLANMLERRRNAMAETLQEAGVTLKDDEFAALYIAGTVDGRWYDPIQASRTWKALSGMFGLVGTQGRAITFHDLRHSFATRAIAAGADVKAVAAVLGHTNAAITLNVYADADPESKRRASNLVARAIAAQGEVEPYAETAKGA